MGFAVPVKCIGIHWNSNGFSCISQVLRIHWNPIGFPSISQVLRIQWNSNGFLCIPQARGGGTFVNSRYARFVGASRRGAYSGAEVGGGGAPPELCDPTYVGPYAIPWNSPPLPTHSS